MKGSISTFKDMLSSTPSKYYSDEYGDNSPPAAPIRQAKPAKLKYIYHSSADASAGHLILGQSWDSGAIRCMQEAYMVSGMMLSSQTASPVVGPMLLPMGVPAMLPSPSLDPVERLEMEVQQLRDATKRLIDSIESRLEFVEQASDSQAFVRERPPHSAGVGPADLGDFFASDEREIADAFSAVADNEIMSDAWVAASRAALGHGDANIRAAAARALAFLDPHAAEGLVLDAMNRESNKVTARVMRSVLRSLNV